MALPGMLVGGLVRQADQAAVAVVGPAMVGTGETLAVALALGADLGPTVRAGVQVDRRLAIGATLDDQVAPADVAGDEVAGLAQFTGKINSGRLFIH
nr:hypothetical protein [Pseudomonas aeruginosa]